MSANDTLAGIKQVKSIPGNLIGTSTINLNVKSYAGYASEENGSNLFCWFFECQKCVDCDEGVDDEKRSNQPGDFPLLIWLNGGPGASSLNGLFLENGPYLMASDAVGTIFENPYAWNKEAHIMYWDNPVGSGYSFNDNERYVNSEDELSDQFYAALQVFFREYSEYSSCPLYITGESYGGKYIPAIAEKILEKNQKVRENEGDKDIIINLKGLSIGNPWMYAALQTKIRIQIGFDLGFLDTGQYKRLMEQYEPLPGLIEEGLWRKAFDLNQGIKNELIACGGNIAIYDIRAWDDGLFGAQLGNYLELPGVKDALHVPLSRPWQDADETGPVTDHLIKDYVSNTADYPEIEPDGRRFDFSLGHLLDRMDEEGKPELRILLYTGNLDMSCGFQGTEQILSNLKWRHQREWQNLNRKVWVEPHTQTRGYIKYYANLTQIVVPHAGHLVPTNQPETSLMMINHFINREKFPSYLPLPLKSED
jgi:vitellogenic carboxypeptidase-like protein